MAEFIYTMSRARKAHGDKVILDNVTLSFLPGAKIGVVGPNGAGKSSVLKIMAGLDTPSNGEAFLSPGYTVGILQQEPPLDETKTVLENVEDGVAEIKGKLDRYNEITVELGEPDADYDTLLAEMGEPADRARPRERLGPRLPARAGHGRAALPAGGRRRRHALRWRAAPRGAVQAAAAGARPAAPRRADQPPRRRVGAVARAAPGEVPRHRRRGHPRPVLPRQRRAVDPRARPRPRLPLRGQLLHLPRDQAGPAQGRGAEGRQARQAPGRGARVGALQRQGPPGQEQVAAGALRGDGRRGREDPQDGLRGDPDPAGPAARSSRHRGRATSPRASATGCSSTTSRSPCRATASSASSARTASARRRCSRC